MFGSGNGDKLSSSFFKTLKLTSVYSGNFKILKNTSEKFIKDHPPKHVITLVQTKQKI